MGLAMVCHLGEATVVLRKKSECMEWSFKFESLCALLDLEQIMTAAASEVQPIVMDGLREEVRRKVRGLFHVLVQTCEGKALRILRGCQKHNGAEAWRLLKGEYQPLLAQRRLALLSSLMSPDLGGPDEAFAEKLAVWERNIQEYVELTGRP
jgi:hypothetical protein